MSVAAAALLRDEAGRVCLVKGNYRPEWHFPGGTVEANESPAAGCRRELREELGLDISVGRLLCLEWVHDEQEQHDALQLVYDGGILDSDARDQIVLTPDELTDHRFVTVSEAAPLVNARNLRRIHAGLQRLNLGGLAELDRDPD